MPARGIGRVLLLDGRGSARAWAAAGAHEEGRGAEIGARLFWRRQQGPRERAELREGSQAIRKVSLEKRRPDSVRAPMQM